MSDHLDFDTDFLDPEKSGSTKEHPHYFKETFPSRRGLFSDAKPSQKQNTPTPKKKTGRTKLIVGAICGAILLILIIIAANTPETNYNTTPTPPAATNIPVVNTAAQNTQSDPLDLFTDGNGATYSCSLPDHAKATSLRPAVYDKTKIATDESYLNTLETKIDNEKASIDASSVSDYSPQYQINVYNAQVDQYNVDLQTYKRAASNYSQEVDSYNAKVDVYNNFLKNNCALQ